MKSRRCAREAALQALYACDSLDDWSPAVVQDFFQSFHPAEEGSDSQNENRRFCEALINGLLTSLDTVDNHISASSTRWSVTRMSRVDRNIIRIATYELAFLPEIPPSVSINEAIEIAKRFGAPDSPTFVNGVLDKVASTLRCDSQTDTVKQTVNE